ncbi:unnamed protein product, partial [Ectocarpus sp. 4 AP-2014]
SSNASSGKLLGPAAHTRRRSRCRRKWTRSQVKRKGRRGRRRRPGPRSRGWSPTWTEREPKPLNTRDR